jgi:hypothetical protein
MLLAHRDGTLQWLFARNWIPACAGATDSVKQWLLATHKQLPATRPHSVLRMLIHRPSRIDAPCTFGSAGT